MKGQKVICVQGCDDEKLGPQSGLTYTVRDELGDFVRLEGLDETWYLTRRFVKLGHAVPDPELPCAHEWEWYTPLRGERHMVCKHCPAVQTEALLGEAEEAALRAIQNFNFSKRPIW